mgnify:CR=1 FL=1
MANVENKVENNLVANVFVPDYISDVKIYSVEKLAKILSDCVEYAGALPERDKIDWHVSEMHINKTFSLDDFVTLTNEFLILTAYSEFRKKNNLLSDINLVSINHKRAFPEKYKEEINRALKSVNTLSHYEFNKLIKNLDTSQRREYQDRFLGREIWDRGYQTIQKTDILTRNGYGKVRM